VLSFWGAGWSLTANIGKHLDARFTMAFPLSYFGLNHSSLFNDMHYYFAVGTQF